MTPFTDLRPLRCALMALTLALFLVFPAAAQSDDPARLTDAPITTTLTATEDNLIRDRLQDVLQSLQGYENVTTAVRGGVVTLTGRVLSYDEVEALDQIADRVEGVVAVQNSVEVTTDVRERVSPVLDRMMRRLTAWIAAIPVLLIAVAGGALVVWAGFRFARLSQPWNRLAPNEFVAEVLRQVVRVAAVLAGVVVALDILGASALLGTVLGAAGIFGLAVGFAVRDSVENFIASIMLSLRSPFRPRDLIEIGGDVGNVVRLTSRATILISPDGNHISIPNATVFKSRIINYTRHPNRRFSFDMDITSNGALTGLDKVMLAALQQADFILTEPGPSVWATNIGDTGVRFHCVGWIRTAGASFEGARSDALKRVAAAVEEAGGQIGAMRLRLMEVDPLDATDSADMTQTEAISHIIEAEINSGEGTNLLTPEVERE
ncbi:mechanosensitive ion channel domain-containing protein [Pseudotabrizicola alkalilacus]|uniref:Small-conductance mechanosensitive channel n=1 Tax=Pseudotabrizicola alkalilacus TaxID=2305252 RepID=A0A411Z323_9RHOB|nr:mechanosensitive ion channel domain-containing protein [Pseudotabrizicola alkalilacus]RGP37476.1 BON domain-containing protein [Pseudotabrizicola alkalilacus]